jgi:hypothetical protein
MRMHGGAQRRAVALERGRPELENGWKCVREIEVVARLRERDDDGSEGDGSKKKGEWGQPRLGPPYL